jgi:hypothetical protein
VGGLSRETRTSDVEKAFSGLGQVQEVKLRTSAQSGEQYAFFILDTRLRASECLAAVEAATVLGRRVKADFARPFNGERERERSRERGAVIQRSTRDERPRETGGVVRLRVENIPSDMEWRELKAVASDYGPVLFTKTWREEDGRSAGIVELPDETSAEKLMQGLDGKRIEGCKEKLRLLLERRPLPNDVIPRRR